MPEPDRLLPKHGGYKHLLSYQLAELIFDITVLFCDKYVRISDRTHDQMVQSGRSGFQNIAEGSVDSGISKKSEIKLTGIAIGCMDELAKDYQKYLQKKKRHCCSNDGVCSKFSLLFYLKKRQDVKNIVTVNRNRTFANSNGNRGY